MDFKARLTRANRKLDKKDWVELIDQLRTYLYFLLDFRDFLENKTFWIQTKRILVYGMGWSYNMIFTPKLCSNLQVLSVE